MCRSWKVTYQESLSGQVVFCGVLRDSISLHWCGFKQFLKLTASLPLHSPWKKGTLRWGVCKVAHPPTYHLETNFKWVVSLPFLFIIFKHLLDWKVFFSNSINMAFQSDEHGISEWWFPFINSPISSCSGFMTQNFRNFRAKFHLSKSWQPPPTTPGFKLRLVRVAGRSWHVCIHELADVVEPLIRQCEQNIQVWTCFIWCSNHFGPRNVLK